MGEGYHHLWTAGSGYFRGAGHRPDDSAAVGGVLRGRSPVVRFFFDERAIGLGVKPKSARIKQLRLPRPVRVSASKRKTCAL